MNILAIADRPARSSIKQILQENHIDLICTLGDLSLFDVQELEVINHIPKLGVYGNHDSGNYFEPLDIQNMHLQTFSYQGFTFGGFEGCVRYKQGTAPMYTQEEASSLMKNFPHVDIFLAHYPPYGINDDQTEIAHTGYQALRDYLDQKEPSYLLHGHTYPKENELVTKYKNTNIVYVYQDKIITT